MPLLINVDDRVEALTIAINNILILEGPAGLTMRRIARESGISTSSMLHHLDSKERLIRLSALATARARHADISVRSRSEGALAFLPAHPDQVLDARAWLAWLELWRSEESLQSTLARARDSERALLAQTLDFTLTTESLDATVALIDGLGAAVCSPVRPMSPDRARAALSRHLGRVPLGVDVTPRRPEVSSWVTP